MFMRFLDWVDEHLVAAVIAVVIAMFLLGVGVGYITAFDSVKNVEQLCADFAQQVYKCETAEEKDFLLESVYGFTK